MMRSLPEGIRHIPDYFDRGEQQALIEAIRLVVAEAPLFVSRMPKTGKPMSVRMTNCGDLGWVTDKERGYRYQAHHPETGRPWPAIPARLLDLWQDVAKYEKPPEACLVNFYDDSARMGLYQDKDEQDYGAPIVSVSLGMPAVFLFGGHRRADKAQRIPLFHGDVVVWGGPDRLRYHGVAPLKDHPHPLLGSQRINLTFRKAG